MTVLPRNGRSRRSRTAYGRINQQHRRMAEEPHRRIGKNRRRTVIVAGDEMTGVYTVELFKNRAFPLHIDLLGKVILNYYVLTLPSQGEFDIHPITTSYPAISTAPPLLPLIIILHQGIQERTQGQSSHSLALPCSIAPLPFVKTKHRNPSISLTSTVHCPGSLFGSSVNFSPAISPTL